MKNTMLMIIVLILPFSCKEKAQISTSQILKNRENMLLKEFEKYGLNNYRRVGVDADMVAKELTALSEKEFLDTLPYLVQSLKVQLDKDEKEVEKMDRERDSLDYFRLYKDKSFNWRDAFKNDLNDKELRKHIQDSITLSKIFEK